MACRQGAAAPRHASLAPAVHASACMPLRRQPRGLCPLPSSSARRAWAGSLGTKVHWVSLTFSATPLPLGPAAHVQQARRAVLGTKCAGWCDVQRRRLPRGQRSRPAQAARRTRGQVAAGEGEEAGPGGAGVVARIAGHQAAAEASLPLRRDGQLALDRGRLQVGRRRAGAAVGAAPWPRWCSAGGQRAAWRRLLAAADSCMVPARPAPPAASSAGFRSVRQTRASGRGGPGGRAPQSWPPEQPGWRPAAPPAALRRPTCCQR